MKRIVVTLCLLLSFSAMPAPAREIDGLVEIALQHDGLKRLYLLHFPKGYDARKPTPLVVALHGGGGSATYMADDYRYGLISKSDAAGFIVAFPNGVSRRRSGMLATWNAGKCCGRARDQAVDDVGFLRKMIEDIGRGANIDRQRVYATGMSNGAMMSYRLACEMSDVIRGIATVAGTDNTRHCAPSQPVPVLHIHAQNDDMVLFDGGSGRRLRGALAAASADFVSVPQTIAMWVKHNHAHSEPRRVLDVTGAHCDLHGATSGGAPVVLCVTTNGGHSWPGGHKDRANEAPSSAINANDVMWNFFQCAGRSTCDSL
jgi:polyhydroxybutyrate depolymerase